MHYILNGFYNRVYNSVGPAQLKENNEETEKLVIAEQIGTLFFTLKCNV